MRFDAGHGYESLAINIMVQAAKDYRKALRDLKKDPKSYEAIVSRNECERFFRSNWCEMITGVDPEILMTKLQKEAGYYGKQM